MSQDGRVLQTFRLIEGRQRTAWPTVILVSEGRGMFWTALLEKKLRNAQGVSLFQSCIIFYLYLYNQYSMLFIHFSAFTTFPGHPVSFGLISQADIHSYHIPPQQQVPPST